MGKPELSKLSALVVDDFSSFRSTIMGMLNKIGIKNISEAAKGQDVLRLCEEHRFDIILCDYNLGSGRNGQHLLEELRFRNWIPRKTLFFMVTAEASKEMVLSAYDCEPDDYLMKPLNLRVLEQRISRQIQQRGALAHIFQKLDSGDRKSAIVELENLSSKPGRHNIAAQKLLGEQYLSNGDWRKAEKLYRLALEARRLDWAVLGLARVLEQKGERKEAIATLDQLTNDSRLFLPAYDELANLHEKNGNLDAVQTELARVTEISPRSILRQRKLATVAKQNGDTLSTLKASMEAMKLGEQSCYKDLQDNLSFLDAAASAIEQNVVPDNLDLAEESKKCLDQMVQQHKLGVDEEGQARLLTARVFALEHMHDDAKKMAAIEAELPSTKSARSIDRELARYQLLNTTEQYLEANQLVDQLLDRFEKNPEVLKKLDKLLPEPQNDENRKQVAKMNKQGIDAYQQGAFDEALACFYKATTLYPRHTGLQLNLLQTLVGKIKLFPDNKSLQQQLQKHLNKSAALVGEGDSPQFTRLAKLREKAVAALKSAE